MYPSKVQEGELNELKRKERYSSYQEDLAFSKELNILRNDFYYQMMGSTTTHNVSLVNFMYKPLDVMSGDAYSVRKIDDYRTFYLLVDGMGKGLSASLTAMLMAAFVNHIIDKMIRFESYSLELLVKESLEYIQPILLDDEALAIDYILFDNHYNTLSYAKFGMPAFLLQNRNNEILRIKSNNPPMSKWKSDFKVDEYSVEFIDKFLFFSDGIVENSVKEEGKTYAQFIEEDFKHSFTKEELVKKMFLKLSPQEDDLTMIFINKLNCQNSLIANDVFDSSLESVDRASEWYSDVWKEIVSEKEQTYDVAVVFTELFMNAYEHGNLAINAKEKHKMLEDDTYIETLLEKEQVCSKKIYVKVHKLEDLSSTYIVTHITDEGEGFDTQILSEIFRNSHAFNGRGVFVSRKNAMGIYYNTKGNTVLFLNKI